MKRKTLGLCVLATVLILVSICTINSQKKVSVEQKTVFDAPCYNWSMEPQETVAIWTREHEISRVYMQRAFLRYEELTGSKVEIVTLPQVEFEGIIIEALERGSGGPDLILGYGGTNIEQFNPDENFYDFSDEPWVEDLTATSINQTIYHGNVIGLPHWEASISGMLYNKTLFRKLGLEVPQTQEEFLLVCQVMKEQGIIPVYMPYKEITMLLYQFPMDSILENESVLKGLNDGTLSYEDIPEMGKILEWYRIMSDMGYLGENYIQNNWDGMDEALKSSRYGMMLCWDTWLYTDFTGNASDFGLMPAFMGVPDQGTFEGPNLGLMIVNRNSPKLDAALNLITFLADPYNYNIAFEGIYTAPVFKNQATSISTPQYVESERLIEKNFRDSTAWLRVRGFSQIDATCIQKYMIAEPGYTIEECLKEMNELRTNRMISEADAKGGDR